MYFTSRFARTPRIDGFSSLRALPRILILRLFRAIADVADRSMRNLGHPADHCQRFDFMRTAMEAEGGTFC